MYFDELDLNDAVLDALYDMRFDTCTPVQEKCIPEILAGHDVLGVAQTGTGKTAAYLLPILSRLQDGECPQDTINCVIMSPTRELAQQIDQAMQGFGYYLDGISSVAIYGGNDGNRYDQELKSLSLGADVIIATPGRLLSHLSMGNADFSKVSFFILDEADRMLDMGFSDDIKKIASYLPDTCQTIMFSATMPEKIEELANTLLKDPVTVKIAVSKPAEKIQQSAYLCYEDQKLGIIKSIFKTGDLKRVIIFSGKKQKVKLINRALLKMNINSGEMHSDLEQAQRDDIMYKFKSGQIDVLVATDIVARGIDIDDISMVINFDVPQDAEDYVHRIGRTARADRDGIAITFVSDKDMYYFKQIEKQLEKVVEKKPLPEGLGDAPEYKVGEKGRRKGCDSKRRGDKPKKKSDKPADETRRKDRREKSSDRQHRNKSEGNDAKTAPANVDMAAAENKKENNRRRRRKPATGSDDRQQAPKAQAQEKQRVEKKRVKADTEGVEKKYNKDRRRKPRHNSNRKKTEEQAAVLNKTQQPEETSKIKSIIKKSLKLFGIKK